MHFMHLQLGGIRLIHVFLHNVACSCYSIPFKWPLTIFFMTWIMMIEGPVEFWVSSSVGIVSSATMVIVAKSIKNPSFLQLPSLAQPVSHFYWHLHYTRLANFLLLSPLLDLMWFLRSLQLCLQFLLKKAFFLSIIIFSIANNI